LLSVCDSIMNSPIAIVDGRPSLASYGEQMLPCYDMTVAVAVQRN
jgi:hypothetical protein